MAATGEEKVVLITGCSTGIGFALALLLAKDKEGRFRVYATMRNLSKRNLLEKEAGSYFQKTLFIKQLDVSSNEEIDKIVEEVTNEAGRIDILVNNAGIGLFGAFETQSMEAIRSMFSTNVYGPIYLTQKLLPLWKKTGGGHVVMITSIAGILGFPFNTGYSASKAALEGFSESLAAECTGFGIRVSIIEPGPVTTKFIESAQEKIKENEAVTEKLDDKTKELVNKAIENTSSYFATMGQTAEDVAEHILQAIDAKEPKLRYLTNNMFSAAVQKKLSDPTGNDVLELLKIKK
eukprot:gene20238-22217_t